MKAGLAPEYWGHQHWKKWLAFASHTSIVLFRSRGLGPQCPSPATANLLWRGLANKLVLERLDITSPTASSPMGLLLVFFCPARHGRRLLMAP